MNLKNKIVVITGGAGLLGFEFAKSISKFNGIPIILDIDQNKINLVEKFFNKKNARYLCLNTDLNDERDVLEKCKLILKKYKKIDCLVNSASETKTSMESSTNNIFEKFEKYNLKLFQDSIQKNLSSIFISTKIIGTQMKKFKKGSIVNIASDVGVISPDHRIYEKDLSTNYKGVKFNTPLSYAMSKSAIIIMTKYLATYWAKYNLRVNSISPSGIFNNHDKKFAEVLSSRIPLNRMANKDEINGAVVFLCSDSSSYITGHNLMVDGGKTIW